MNTDGKTAGSTDPAHKVMLLNLAIKKVLAGRLALR